MHICQVDAMAEQLMATEEPTQHLYYWNVVSDVSPCELGGCDSRWASGSEDGIPTIVK